MTSAVETFVVALSRVSRNANRHVARLQRADRDDIVAAALAWCWEHREQYTPDVPLDKWFHGAVRNARTAFFRAEERAHSATALANMQADVGDDPSVQAEAVQAAEVLAAGLTDNEVRVASLVGEGYTNLQIRHKLGRSIGNDLITNAKRKLRQLTALLPEASLQGRDLRDMLARTTPKPASDGAVEGVLSGIDRAIERLDFPPTEEGADCPPCWRCKWFEGYLPGDHKSVRLTVADPQVRDAVTVTEIRKIDIATRVRSGDIGFTGTGRNT